MDVKAAWLKELEHPTEAFFEAFAARVQEDEGILAAACETVVCLVPRVDWAGYQPQVPHGLLGLWAVLRLRPLLTETSFLRILATQLHAFAHEGRPAKGYRLPTFAQGSGHWGNLTLAIETHRPSLAWGEAVGMPQPMAEDFARIATLVSGDMACVGHKAVMARCLGDLHGLLGDQLAGRRLLGIAAWLAASEPADLFWHRRIRHRLGETPDGIAQADPRLDFQALEELARLICEVGLVELLDQLSARVRAGIGSGDLLAAFALAAAWKQLDARRDLEGKTAWIFVYLCQVEALSGPEGHPEPWLQAAALINLFPSEEAVTRLKPKAPARPLAEPGTGLLEAILDGEAPEAMHYVSAMLEQGGQGQTLKLLAEAAALNDPVFNHSHHILAVASVAELLPRVPAQVGGTLLVALAKMLANSQGSCDLGRRAEAQFR